MGRIVKRVLVSGMLFAFGWFMLSGTVAAQEYEKESYLSKNSEKVMLEEQQLEERYIAYEADTIVSGDYKYILESDGTATITKYTGSEEHVVVPASLDGYSVKKIGKFTFFRNNVMKSLRISEGIEILESTWLCYCDNLVSLSFPSTVVLPKNEDLFLGEYPADIFGEGNQKVQEITVSEKNEYFTVYGEDVYSKDGKVFLYHPIGSEATKVSIREGVVEIGSIALQNSVNLKEVVLPDSLEKIGYWAFYNTKISEITIPENCKVIDCSAFKRTEIKKLHIPASVVELFNQSDREIEITVSQDNKVFCMDQGCLYNIKEKRLIWNQSVNLPETLVVRDGVEIIGQAALCYMTDVKKVVLPNSVKKLEPNSLCCNEQLEEVVLPPYLESMEGSIVSLKVLKKVYFTGDAPKVSSITLNFMSSYDFNIYYPAGNPTWSEEALASSEGWNRLMSKLVPYEYMPEVPAKPYQATNVVSGVHVYWKTVTGASKYGLWRSETGENGTYKWIANPKVTHFTDTTVESGKTYHYKVTAMNSVGGHSEKSEAIQITYVATPDISSRVNKAAGVELGWKKVEGATGYAIYRKSYSGMDAWVRVGTIEGNNTFSWIDTGVQNKNGSIYKYTIRALAGEKRDTLSGCRNAGRTMVRLTSLNLSEAKKATANSIKCSWGTTKAATGYEVRFVVNGKVYKSVKIEDYKIGTKTINGLKAGQTYQVQVRSYRTLEGVGTFYSGWSVAKNVKL